MQRLKERIDSHMQSAATRNPTFRDAYKIQFYSDMVAIYSRWVQLLGNEREISAYIQGFYANVK